MRTTQRISASMASFTGYILLLLTFASLGLFIVAFASRSASAAALGVTALACLAGSAGAFITAAKKLDLAGAFDNATSAVSIFTTPPSDSELARYLSTYRDTRAVTRPVTLPAPTAHDRPPTAEHIEPVLRSA
ncbi:MAG TPA: hypothetical protein PKK01_08620 [Mycobacterium sp.]|nr:MAG: hypothetical protein E6Q56_01060 [Mycobacterium sp.]HOB49361.1 hypothetical protein [Mycobacterium sp.]HPZ94450.1 hypothetical protein [Mycobacterium sp.]HQE15045.1 hypothetical protein [Mycobacterium sp.]